MIDRDKAWQIATQRLREIGLGTGVIDVRSMSESAGHRLPSLYNVDLAGCWIAYAMTPGASGPCASTILCIDAETGHVVYAGLANDEG